MRTVFERSASGPNHPAMGSFVRAPDSSRGSAPLPRTFPRLADPVVTVGSCRLNVDTPTPPSSARFVLSPRSSPETNLRPRWRDLASSMRPVRGDTPSAWLAIDPVPVSVLEMLEKGHHPKAHGSGPKEPNPAYPAFPNAHPHQATSTGSTPATQTLDGHQLRPNKSPIDPNA